MDLDILMSEIKKLNVSDEFLENLRTALTSFTSGKHIVIYGIPDEKKDAIKKLLEIYTRHRIVRREDLIKDYL
jgi:hypothetical protein